MDYIKGVIIMAVPENIRNVERPVNTIVEDTGRPGPNRYPVRERATIKYVHGGNPQPRNGKVIGHIIDNQFVPIPVKKITMEPDMLSYGSAALFKSVMQDILADLLSVYSAKDAYTIIAIAALRVVKPGVSDKRLSTHYERKRV